MAPRIMPCRIRVESISSTSTSLLPISQSTEVTSDLRLKWSRAILEIYHNDIDSQKLHELRGWDLILACDGQVENVYEQSGSSQSAPLLLDEGQPDRYPAHYQVPEVGIQSFDGVEKLRRTELFAVGSILYEVASSAKPFHDKTDEVVQSLFTRGDFPEDVWEMRTAVSILCCWCPEIRGLLQLEAQREAERSFFDRLGQHARTNPGIFSLQVLGGVASVASLAALPVLGMVGFSAVGPVAGSVAAGWQGSIGLVQAGSLFAWCQSAAMGGAAVGGIIAAGASGVTVAAGATALQALRADPIPASILKEKFEKAWSELTSKHG